MVIVLMGPAGVGKSTVGRRLAGELQWSFFDGDTLHPTNNIAKMRHGVPLTDADRRLWLERLGKAVEDWDNSDTIVVLACSLLKQTYRSSVLSRRQHVKLVYLKAHPDLLKRRLAARVGHFAGVPLLDSQLHTLEEPTDALILDASATPDSLVARIRSAFAL